MFAIIKIIQRGKLNTEAVDVIVAHIQKKLETHSDVFVVALDGMSGTGKTTIAKKVAHRLDAVNVLCDDFFTGGRNSLWAKKSTREMIDNAIDWRRLRREVIEPLKAGKAASWHPFNWKAFGGLDSKTITAQPKQVVILDGAYTARKELSDVVDYTILITLPHEARVRRVIEREGEAYSKDWHDTWQASMDYYFTVMRPPESFDLIVETR